MQIYCTKHKKMGLENRIGSFTANRADEKIFFGGSVHTYISCNIIRKKYHQAIRK